MKSDIGVDADSGLVRSVIGTAANAADATQADALLHDDEQHALGDAGYRGEDRREEAEAGAGMWRRSRANGESWTHLISLFGWPTRSSQSNDC